MIRGYEQSRSMILIRFFKTIQVGENSSQISRHFKKEQHSRKDDKLHNSHLEVCLVRPYA